MKNLRFICAQPANLYYTWQVETMLTNFIEMGVNLNNIDIVCWKENGVIPEEWSKLANGYAARFFFYDDTRETKHYISSIRPNILKQHFLQHPYLREESILYHDSDIIFTKSIKDWITDEMINDNNWYGSDTRWYIAHSYIKSKGQDVIDEMCKIMDLPESLIEENELNSIGAQYLMKGIDYHFWNRVEIDCELLYKNITDLNNEKIIEDRKTMSPGEERTPYHPLQIWCADMWAVLWGGWRLGYNTICHPNFDFSWGTSNEDEYFKMNIFHNAGVISNEDGKFYKANFIDSLPYNEQLKITPNTASWHYWNWIQKTKEKSVLL
jgi:hypothetical protein